MKPLPHHLLKCVISTQISRRAVQTHLSVSASTIRGMTLHSRLSTFLIWTEQFKTNPAYGVYISQLVRYGRICTSKVDFMNRLRGLSLHLRQQGFVTNLLHYFFYLVFIFLFSPFYWAGFVAQRERAQQDFKVPYKVPHLTHPPFTYQIQPQHRDHPTLIRIVPGFFNVPQNYQRIVRRDLRLIVIIRED